MSRANVLPVGLGEKMQNAMDITFATKVEQEKNRRMVTKGHPKTFIQKHRVSKVMALLRWDCIHNTGKLGL